MRVVFSIALTARLVALGFALGIIVGLWVGIEGAGTPREEVPAPEVTTTAPANPELAQ
jgi:hypothetical protein